MDVTKIASYSDEQINAFLEKISLVRLLKLKRFSSTILHLLRVSHPNIEAKSFTMR